MESSRPSEREGIEAHEEGGAAYARVGDEVSGILIAAENAAAEIRAAATRDAEETKTRLEQYASAVRAEADAHREEATSYGQTHRAEAHAYAEDVRRRADETSARILEEAEERARLIVTDATRKAAELEAEGRRLLEALSTAADAVENRIRSMLAVFRTIIGELEELVREERRAPDSAGAEDLISEEPLDEGG